MLSTNQIGRFESSNQMFEHIRNCDFWNYKYL